MKLLFVITALALLSSHNTWAIECYEPSPSYADLGDMYFNVELIPVEMKEQSRAIDTFRKKLKGRWQGRLSETLCTGTDANPIMEQQQSKVNVEFAEFSSALLHMNFEKLNHKQQIKRIDQLSWLIKDNILELDILDNSINANEKQRKAGANWGSRLVETISKVERDDRQLNVELTHYSNGVLTLVQKFELSKR